jgi:hypothetical protein
MTDAIVSQGGADTVYQKNSFVEPHLLINIVDCLDYTIFLHGNVPISRGAKEGSSGIGSRPWGPVAGIQRQAKPPIYQCLDERVYALAAGYTTRSAFPPCMEVRLMGHHHHGFSGCTYE